MPIKNYTASKSAMQYINQVQNALVEHGAIGIQTMFDADKRISALAFGLPNKDGKTMSFALPCEWRRFQQVLKSQRVRRWEEDEYCYRVAWANIKDWVLAQMALYETHMVDMPQVFLPFAQGKGGKTLYEIVQGSNLLLGDGNDNQS